MPSFTLVVVVTSVGNLANCLFPAMARPLEGNRTDICNVAMYRFCQY